MDSRRSICRERRICPSFQPLGMATSTQTFSRSLQLQVGSSQHCACQLWDSAFSTTPYSVFSSRLPRPARPSESCPTATLGSPKSSPTMAQGSKVSDGLLLLAGRGKGAAGPLRRLTHKVPLYDIGLWETNERDFKINDQLFLSAEGLKCLSLTSWKTNRKGSLWSGECFHLSWDLRI